MSSTVTSGLDSGLAVDNKKVRAEKPKDTCWPSEDVRPHNSHGETASAKGGNSSHPSHAHSSGKEERKSFQGRMPRDGSSSRSHSRDNDVWKCVNPECKNFNYILSFKCVKCKLPQKISNALGPKLHKK